MSAPGRAVMVVAVAALLLAVGAAPAAAHAVGGAQASNYQTRILSIQPVVPGLTVEVVDAGARLRVRNHTGREVMVLGYAGEPYLRVGPAGVFENRRSPATYLNAARINPPLPPPDASADAPPLWRRIGDGDTVSWHDHRAHWMGASDPPEVKAAPNRTQVVVPGWQAELRVGNQPVRVSGDLRWVPGPSPWPWVAVAVAWLLLVVVASRQRAWPRLLAALTGLLIAVDVVHTVGIWTGSSASAAAKAYASLGSWAGWILGALAIYRLLGPHPRRGSIYLVLGAVLMADVGGIGDLGSLYRSQLAVAFPDPVTRVLVATTLGLGVGLVIGGLRLARPRRPGPAGNGRPTALRRRPSAPGSRGPPLAPARWTWNPSRLRGRAVKRFAPLATALVGLLVLATTPLLAGAATPAASPTGALSGKTGTTGYHEPICQSRSSICIDAYDNPGDEYLGHDEPSLLFKSGHRGSGNDITWTLRLPKEPPVKPRNDGSGGTWNFQLRPTFWFGLTLCDSESAPEYTKRCRPDTDANNLVNPDPAAPDYIGKHPGNAFMELQFYGPGYVPQFEGFGCAAHQYCAAMTIDSFNLNQNTGVANTEACDDHILGGEEPINWAYITKSGRSQAPADPLFTGTFSAPNFAAVNPDYNKDLLMSPGDLVRIHLHDTPAGFQADLSDLKTHQSGSMTASVANGFAHVLYTPNAATCQSAPYAFHPEYSTANPRGNTWSAHTYNLAFSDEIGHFENCLQIDADFNCAVPTDADRKTGLDEDDDNNFCVPGEDALVVHINGCFSADEDFDGPSYQRDWPGTNPNAKVDRRLHPEPVRFTSATTNGHNYPRIAFETDLPRIEAADAQDNPPFCDRTTGANCVNPPAGAEFYPFYTTANLAGTCVWQQGGNFIPGTTRHFGGSSTAEYGPLLQTVYPAAGFTTVLRYNNFNSGDRRNPCPVP